MHTLSRRALTLAAAVLIAPLLTAGQCERTGSVDSDRPAVDWNGAPAAARQALIRVPQATGPYTIWVTAHRVGEARGDHNHELVPGAGYSQTLTYSSGTRIEITVTVTGRADDTFTCRIDDGPRAVVDHHQGQAYCRLTTSQ